MERFTIASLFLLLVIFAGHDHMLERLVLFDSAVDVHRIGVLRVLHTNEVFTGKALNPAVLTNQDAKFNTCNAPKR